MPASSVPGTAPRFMTSVDAARYARAMRSAREDVYVIATRRGINLRLLDVEFDAGQAPGPHDEHVLRLRLSGSDACVEEANIPHEWIATVGTGFIDARFANCVTGLLAKLEKKLPSSASRSSLPGQAWSGSAEFSALPV